MTVESVSSELLADLAVELPAAVRQPTLPLPDVPAQA